MEHKIMIDALPKGGSPSEDMLEFYTVRLEKMTFKEGKILVPKTVGVRCVGYFSITSEKVISEDTAKEALSYALTTAQFRLSSNPQELLELFTSSQEKMIEEANAALVRSESDVRLEKVVFAYADYCIADSGHGASSQLYSGFIIGQNATRQVTVSKPLGIEGEWQCVCGVYNAPADCCKECGVKRPVL